MVRLAIATHSKKPRLRTYSLRVNAINKLHRATT